MSLRLMSRPGHVWKVSRQSRVNIRSTMYRRGLLQEAAVSAMSPMSTAGTPAVAADGADTATPNLSTNIFFINSHFSSTMIIILVILLSAFLFMAFFAVYVRRCSGEEDNTSWPGNSRRRSSRRDADEIRGHSGVDPSLVESYPIVSYAVAKKKGCYECIVCLGEFEGGDKLKQLPKCKHLFHPACIGLWLESHTTCPLCRRSLVNSDRWVASFRWGGGSSRGSSRRNGQESVRSRRSGEITSSMLGRADSGTGRIGTRSLVDGRSGSCPQAEMSLQLIEAGAGDALLGLPTSCVLASPHRLLGVGCPHGERASSPVAGVVRLGSSGGDELSSLLPHGAAQASSVSSDLMPHGSQECCVSTDVMPREYHSSEVAGSSEHASSVSSELARGKPHQAAAVVQGWRKLMGRSNSTGHSEWSRRAVLQATGCMPRISALRRSRSVSVEGVDNEEQRLAGPSGATSAQGPYDSTSAFAIP